MSDKPVRPRCPCTSFAGDQYVENFNFRCNCCLRPVNGSDLHAAAAGGDTTLLTQLLTAALPGQPLPHDEAGSSPIHSAAAQSHAAAVHLLLAFCGEHAVAEECNRRNVFGFTPLHCLAANPLPGSCATLTVLLNSGADIQARVGQSDAEPPGESALLLAAQHSGGGQATPLVHALLNGGLDPLEPAGPLFTTALEFACAAGDVEVVKLMLAWAPTSPWYYKHSQEMRHRPGFDPAYLLSLAVAYNCVNVVEFLLNPPASFHAVLTGQQLRADPASVLDGPNGECASRMPSEDGGGEAAAAQMVGKTSNVDVDLPIVLPYQMDASLHRAIALGHLEMCRVLVAAGACGSHWRCDWGMLADWHEDLEQLGWECRFPLLHDAAEPDHNDTPLILALKLQHYHIASWLIKRTAAAYTRLDSKNRTALHYLARSGKPNMLRWCLETGLYNMRVDGGDRAINQLDKNGYSALAYAIAMGDVRALELLCRHRANVRRRVMTRYGPAYPLAAAMLAPSSDTRSYMLFLLVEFGAEVDPDDLDLAIKLGLVAELRFLLDAMRQQELQLDGVEAAQLMLTAATHDQIECAEVLLAQPLDPNTLLYKIGEGQVVSLLSLSFERNWAMWDSSFEYDEDTGRTGWQQDEDGEVHRVCMSSTRARALRLMQSLVLAGSDARPVLECIQQDHSATDFREVAECLQKPKWIKEQHVLWPAAFKAAVRALLLGLHRVAAGLAGSTGGSGGGGTVPGRSHPEAQGAAFPFPAVSCMVAHMAALWPAVA